MLPDAFVQIVSRRRLRTALLGVVCIALSAPAQAQSSLPLIQKQDLVYVGAFRVPSSGTGGSTLSYGGTALGFNPAGSSLFMTGHDQYQWSVEISIPAPVADPDVSRLPTATVLQQFRDATEGKLPTINPSDPNWKKIGGHLVHNGKLYVTGFSYYDGGGTQGASHFVRPLSLATTGQVVGPIKLGTQYPGFVHGYMTPVPPEWQPAFGGPALTGNCCLSITGVQSNGPAASVFDPATLGSSGLTAPATAVLGYPYPNILGPGEASKNGLFNLTTRIKGAVFPYGTRSLLFIGRHGVGNYCYGLGADCNDPVDPYKGTHAYPYVYQVWAYDALDLLAVKNGTKPQHQVQPYSVWTFNLPYESGQPMHVLGGAAYDPATSRVYVSQECADVACTPIIHVFKVAIGSAIVPSAPTNVRAQ